MAVPLETGNDFSPGVPVVLFEHRSSLSPIEVAEYSVTPDGQRFIMNGGGAFALTRLNVVLNWTEELKRLVPIEN